MKKLNTVIMVALIWTAGSALAYAQTAPAPATQNSYFEKTFISHKTYADPFNEVDVDVIFTNGGDSWRVPTFWRGGNSWTVRFAPPAKGEYTYRLESTDKSNPDLNGHETKVTLVPYSGPNPALKHGMLRVSGNKRYFEYQDGTPFFWLGDTWWDGLSDRLSWEGFQTLTNDRKKKGFTVIQLVAGLIPSDEENAPVDPGFHNEGGQVYDPEFKQVNPKYFDYADRRIRYLFDSGITPVIFGAWSQALRQMGVQKMEKHWRYIIARYGAYPLFWSVGGEVFDPPTNNGRNYPDYFGYRQPGSWTQVARYLRSTDPYHHPVTVHEVSVDDLPLQDESLTDFHLFQPGHSGWASIQYEIGLLNEHYARTDVVKPLVVGEIGYERLGGWQLEDFQRVAFWLGTLNGAAGFTYGANGVWESYTADKPLARYRYSFMTWEEGMKLPGSYYDGMASKLVRQYQWWKFEPHPEWLALPRGTTLLEPRSGGNNEFHIHLGGFGDPEQYGGDVDAQNDWKDANGNFYLPYAAGIPREVRMIYLPSFNLDPAKSPTILDLEKGVRYHAFYWDPSYGIKFDLGAVEIPSEGSILREERFASGDDSKWSARDGRISLESGHLVASGATTALLSGFNEENFAVSVSAQSDADAGILLRYQDADNYLAAMYSARDKSIYLIDRRNGKDGKQLAATPVPDLSAEFRLSAEVRDAWATVSASGGGHTYHSAIEKTKNAPGGSVGLLHSDDGATQRFGQFELRKSPAMVHDDHLEKKLFDANGIYRGELKGGPMRDDSGAEPQTSWDDYGKEKIILLGAYRPDRVPTSADWLLVLEAKH